MAPPQPRPSDIQALLDTVRASSVYGDFDETPRTDGSAEQAVADLLRQVQTQFGEVTRGRDTLAMAVRELEGQLAKTNAELASLRTERDHLTRLKGLYERKFASIRELAQQ